MTRNVILTVCCNLVALSLFAAGANQEWPDWQGPTRDGKSTETGLLKTWPTNGPTLVWKATGMGQGFSSATIAGGAIYTTGIKDGHLHLIALNMDGSPKWYKDVEPGFVNDHPGSRASAVFDSGNIYLETDLGKVGCYDASTGTEKWTRKFSEFGGKQPHWGFSESVLVSGELVIATPGGTNCIVAFDKKTGATIDSAISAINTKLQQSDNATLRSITAVQETAANGTESINFVSSLASFDVAVSSSAGASVGDGLNGGVAKTFTSAMNGSASSIAIDTQAPVAPSAPNLIAVLSDPALVKILHFARFDLAMVAACEMKLLRGEAMKILKKTTTI